MTRRLAALLALLLLLPGGLWLAPRLTDWTARRDRLAELAADRLGRPVTLSGPVRLVLLPSPMLEAEGVAVGRPEDPAGFGASALRLRLDGWALLLGRLAPREVTLVGADIRLPWPPVPSFAFSAGLASFEASVVDGRVSIGALVLVQVRARLSAGSQSEALRVTGSFVPAGILPAVAAAAPAGLPGAVPAGARSAAADGARPAALGDARPLALGDARPLALGDARPLAIGDARPLAIGDARPGAAGEPRRDAATAAVAPGAAATPGAPAATAIAAFPAPLAAWAGREVRFDATLGRAGLDGAMPLDLTLSSGGTDLAARGVLPPSGGLEGSATASGPDLSLLLPGPPGAFRAAGRLSASAELIVADELSLDVAGSPARGALTLRLRPAPRLDLALAAGRLELDPWLASLRGSSGIPFGLDLSAEAASFRGVALRRLRASVVREADRLSLTDGAALLPGDTSVDLAGATAGGRLEALLGFEGSDLRATLAALGWPLDSLAPGRLRRGEGRARLVLEDGQVALPELSASIDGARLSGAGVLRTGTRPGLGLGLTVDRLDLDGLLRPGRAWEDIARDLGGFDANLRLAVDRLGLGLHPDGAGPEGVVAERVGLDAALENGRLTLRQLSAQLVGVEVTASGTALLGPQPRLADGALELAAPDPRPLLALIPGTWPDRSRMAAEPLTLRLTGSGPPEALALRGEADWAELRGEGSLTLDWPARRGVGALSLRHPGAPRLAASLFGPGRGAWLGDGSLSLVAAGSVGPQGLAAERFDLVAGGLRLGGQLALATTEARPRLTGRVAAEGLPLPPLGSRGDEPLPLGALRALDAELAVTAQRLGPWGLPVLEAVEGGLTLRDGALRLLLARGLLSGGAVSGTLALDASGGLPRLSLEGQLAGAAIGGPLGGLPFDLTAGVAEATARLAAVGNSPAALLATLEGEASLRVRDGVLTGLDVAAARAATAAPGPGAAAALRAALLGSTGFDALEVTARLAQGRALLTQAALAAPGDATLEATGEVDLPRGALDLALRLHPPEGPDPVLRLTGNPARPRRAPELAPWLRWRAERGG